MPNHKSAIKRVRQTKRRTERNTTVRSSARTSIKKVRAAIEEKNKEEAQKHFQDAMKQLHSASSKGILHKNNASRRISRLAKQINKL